MRAIALAILTLAVAAPLPQATPTLLDPVGKWTFAATLADGQGMTGTMDVTGTLGAYKGTAVAADGTVVPITDVLTSPTAMVLVLQLPSSFAVVKIARDSTGKLAGQWGELTQVMPVVLTRAGR